METQPLDKNEDHASAETPEDVAILYSWANLEGAKYRDFSANRREYRAQMRHRAAEQLRMMELRAQSEAEAAAAEAEAEAAAAHAEADAATVKLAASRSMQSSGSMKAAVAPADKEAEEQVEHMRRSSLREAAQQARRAAAERLEAARRAEAAALADSIARREEREIAEAQASALRQAAQYAEAEVRSRQKKATQPENPVPGRISDPYGPQVIAEGEYFERPGTPVAELEAIRFRQQREYIEQNTGAELPEFRMPETVIEPPPRAARVLDVGQAPLNPPGSDSSRSPSARPRGYRPDQPSGVRPAATDESLIGQSSQGDFAGGSMDFEPRRLPKPVYEERHLSIARDAHRLDEAGALQLRREEKRAADLVAGIESPEPLRGAGARVVVPSIPYKEFRRTNGANAGGLQSVEPDDLSRTTQPLLDESGWRTAESLIGSGHSKLRRSEPAQEAKPSEVKYQAPVTDAVAERWVPPSYSTPSEPAINAGHQEVPGAGRASYGAAQEPTSLTAASEVPRRVASATTNPPARDSWGLAWEQPDPRVADSQPTWSNRADPVSTPAAAPETPRGVGSKATVPVDASGPAWLYPKTQGPRFVDSLVDSSNRRRVQLATQSLKVGSGQTYTQPARDAIAARGRGDAAENTLQHSREQVASRWFALKSVFANSADRDKEIERPDLRDKKPNPPFVVVYSLTGGVGKTSLVATLGRALSSLGEKVLLTDTTTQGLLPFYFGASELHAGVVRTFSPPSGSSDAPIHMVSYDCTRAEKDTAKNETETHSEVLDELVANSQQANRVLLDLNANCGWMIGRMTWMKPAITPTVLVPLAADMNSVIGLQAIERSFNGLQDADGKPLQPVYLLNQFDASVPLHLDVREVLKQQLGERLLPFVIRRAIAVSEALAEGMTIVDYDPESDVARDYMGVANWLRNTAAPATVGFRNLRWSER